MDSGPWMASDATVRSSVCSIASMKNGSLNAKL